MTKTSKLLFVYGTLKRGYHNHRLLEKGKFISEAVLTDYCIYSLGGYPGISPKELCIVHGELFEITEDMLPRLDRLEGVCHDAPMVGLYRRELETVLVGERLTAAEAYVYIYNGESRTIINGEPRTIIESGVWT